MSNFEAFQNRQQAMMANMQARQDAMHQQHEARHQQHTNQMNAHHMGAGFGAAGPMHGGMGQLGFGASGHMGGMGAPHGGMMGGPTGGDIAAMNAIGMGMASMKMGMAASIAAHQQAQHQAQIQAQQQHQQQPPVVYTPLSPVPQVTVTTTQYTTQPITVYAPLQPQTGYAPLPQAQPQYAPLPVVQQQPAYTPLVPLGAQVPQQTGYAPLSPVNQQSAYTPLVPLGAQVPAQPLLRGKFDGLGYLTLHPDVKAAGMDAFAHYKQYGHNENRTIQLTTGARGTFDPMAYLNAHPDVKAAGMDPFVHYSTYGHNEARDIFVIPQATAQVTPIVQTTHSVQVPFGHQQLQQVAQQMYSNAFGVAVIPFPHIPRGGMIDQQRFSTIRSQIQGKQAGDRLPALVQELANVSLTCSQAKDIISLFSSDKDEQVLAGRFIQLHLVDSHNDADFMKEMRFGMNHAAFTRFEKVRHDNLHATFRGFYMSNVALNAVRSRLSSSPDGDKLRTLVAELKGHVVSPDQAKTLVGAFSCHEEQTMAAKVLERHLDGDSEEFIKDMKFGMSIDSFRRFEATRYDHSIWSRGFIPSNNVMNDVQSKLRSASNGGKMPILERELGAYVLTPAQARAIVNTVSDHDEQVLVAKYLHGLLEGDHETFLREMRFGMHSDSYKRAFP